MEDLSISKMNVMTGLQSNFRSNQAQTTGIRPEQSYNVVTGLQPNFRSNQEKTAGTKSEQSDNLIVRYLENIAIQNKSNLVTYSEPQYTKAFGNDQSVKIFDPIHGKYIDSGIFENMKVYDSNGNTVQSVDYQKDGNKIIQKFFVKCVNGTTVNKEVVNDGNKKTMTLVFKNSSGKSIIEENRTYEKIDNDTEISTHNGKTYKISGLSGDVLTVEHNGQKTTINLADMIQENMESLEGGQEKISDKKVNNEQKEMLKNYVKNLSGDIILKFNEEIKKLTWLDGQDCFFNYDGSKIKMYDYFGINVFLHELGHGINCDDSKSSDKHLVRWSDDKYYSDTRNFEIKNFKTRNKNKNAEYIMQKFMNCEYFVEDGMPSDYARKFGADEEFAELYSFINDIDISDGAPGWNRPLSVVQYLPYSTQIAYNKMKSLY